MATSVMPGVPGELVRVVSGLLAARRREIGTRKARQTGALGSSQADVGSYGVGLLESDSSPYVWLGPYCDPQRCEGASGAPQRVATGTERHR
jgi:hypothetical protein